MQVFSNRMLPCKKMSSAAFFIRVANVIPDQLMSKYSNTENNLLLLRFFKTIIQVLESVQKGGTSAASQIHLEVGVI